MSTDLALERTQIVGAAPDEAFAFFADPWNLEAITPPWLRFRIVEAPPRLEEGSLLRYRLRLFGVPVAWRTEIVEWRPPRSFRDVQLSGPYPLWEHTHRLAPAPGGTEIYDHVRYSVPGGLLAPLVRAVTVRRWLEEIFDYRAVRVAELLGPPGSARAGSSASKDAPPA
ncbi:MAG TPA: SRPBCC family protein [Gaiellaceae bacterium]|nr:SRPBCC family protein [Gaiellaceae bacterium]